MLKNQELTKLSTVIIGFKDTENFEPHNCIPESFYWVGKVSKWVILSWVFGANGEKGFGFQGFRRKEH